MTEIDMVSFIDEYETCTKYVITQRSIGRDLFAEWLRLLRDVKAQAAVIQRMLRVAGGNFGDHKSCGAGVWELRLTLGPGYRVYYALDGTRIVLLLGAGDKGTQVSDIRRAKACWKDWQERADEGQESR